MQPLRLRVKRRTQIDSFFHRKRAIPRTDLAADAAHAECRNQPIHPFRLRPLADREYCSECRTVFCGSFETESVQKEMDVLSVVVFSGGPGRDRLRQIL